MASSGSLKIYPKAIVCEDSVLKGDITIGNNCVVHPKATILAEAGPIVIGENCIIEEYATIAHRVLDANEPGTVLTIGPNNVFEVGCTVEALQIGERNIFECKSYVSSKVRVPNGCVIGSGCRLSDAIALAENTVVYGRDCVQRDALEKQSSQTLQLDFLRKVLPNYHHLKKPTVDLKAMRSADM